jgi:hypothetical protein
MIDGGGGEGVSSAQRGVGRRRKLTRQAERPAGFLLRPLLHDAAPLSRSCNLDQTPPFSAPLNPLSASF